jgi:hypothetical protein
MKYIKDFIVQINSKEESIALGQFLNSINISTNGYLMNGTNKSNAYIIKNNKICYLTSEWGSRFSHLRLFQNLDELKRDFESVNINENNYEIY